MRSLLGKLNDGGPAITYTIIILLLVIVALFIRSLLQNDFSKKSRDLMASISWFALAWGYLGRTIGLIMAFDNVAAAGEITPQALSGGLKMALVGPMAGLITFALARIFIFYLQLKAKREEF